MEDYHGKRYFFTIKNAWDGRPVSLHFVFQNGDLQPITSAIWEAVPASLRKAEWQRTGIPVLKMEKSGYNWVDCVGNYSGFAAVIVSQKVIESVVKHGLTGLDITPVHVDIPKDSKRLKPAPCNYYFIVPVGKRLEYEWRAYERMEEDGYIRYMPIKLEDRVVGKHSAQSLPKLSSWDGNDFIAVQEGKALSFMNCTRRVVEVAKEDEWTNFDFEPIDRVGNSDNGDFQKKSWPPETWYPPNQPEGPHVVE